MTLFHGKFRIESSRLKGWDYSSNGHYFVTICTNNRKHYFGHINNGSMNLSKIGEIAEKCWIDIPNHFSSAGLDEFIVMPNHIHGVVIIDKRGRGRNDCRDAACGVSTTTTDNHKTTLGRIINSYKSAVSNICHKNGFEFKWQFRYHDRIIRNKKSLDTIRRYIVDNPAKWLNDRNY